MITDKLYHFFIPFDIAKNDVEYTSAKYLISTCVVAFIVTPIYAVLYWYLNFAAAVHILLIADALMMSSLLVLKYAHSIAMATNTFNASLTLLLVWLAYYLGGLYAPTTVWLIMPGLIGSFIGGFRSGIWWCLINSLILVSLYLLAYFKYPFPISPVTNPLLLLFVCLSGLVLVIVILVCVYDLEKTTTMKKLRQLAYNDSLTGLPNRLAYEEFLRDAIYHARATAEEFAVMLIDIDNFKRVNNLYGESLGNLLIKQIVDRIQNNIQHTEKMTRMGGDQFKIIIENKLPEQTKEIANILLTALKIPYQINQNEINITVSIGIAIYKPHTIESEYIERYVDLALLHAKNKGGDNYQFYTEELATEEASRVEIECNIPNAILNNELELYFQPQYDTKRPTKITAIEALLRWKTRTLGDIPSDIFIPVAEKIGIITQIGEWVFRESCKKYMEWQSAGMMDPDILLAINVSPIQVYSKHFIPTIEKIISETGIPPEKLELELTETSIISDEDNTVMILHRLRQLGIHTVIDDFGSGYTSLRYLASLPVTGLKIDKLFLENMLRTTNSAVVIEAIIKLAHKINLTVVVEGVENSQQLDYLDKINCDFVQGYFLSKPLDVENMRKLLKASKQA